MSSSSSSALPSTQTEPPLLYPFKAGADLFRLAKSDDAEDSVDLRNRCWFAACIHALAHEPVLFALTQETVVVMDSLGSMDHVLLALGAAPSTRTGQLYTLGMQLAYLVQQSSCPSLVMTSDMDVFKNALERTLAVFPSKDGGGAQAFADYYDRLRTTLLDACNELARTSASSEPFMIVASGSNHLATDLAETTTSTPEWIRVDRKVPGVPVMYHPRDVRVGTSAVYEVAFTVQYAGAHFAFCDHQGQPLDSHGGTLIEKVEEVPGWPFVRNTQSSHIFLRRLRK